MIRFIILSAFVFAFPFLQWLGDDPRHADRPYEPRATDFMFVHEVPYRFGAVNRTIITDITVWTIYDNGGYGISKGEKVNEIMGM